MDPSCPSPAKEEQQRHGGVDSVRRLSGGLCEVLCRSNLTPGEKQVVYSGLVAWVGVSLGLVLAYPTLVLDTWVHERGVSLSHQETSWFRSVVYLGSIPGSVVGGLLMQMLGPRRLLLLLLPALALAWLLLPLVTPHAPTLIVLRALQGVLVAGCGLCVYVYPCEVVEARRRDLVGALPEAAFSLGFLLSYLLAAALHWTTVVLLVPSCLVLPTAIAVAIVPESPAWFLHRGRLNEAREVLAALRPAAASVEKELLAIQLEDNKRSGKGSSGCPVFLLRHPRFLLPVLAALTLVLLKESTGQMVLVLTLNRVLSGGAVGMSPLWGSVLVGAARVVANLGGCCFLLSRFPRRVILSRSSLTAGVAMVVLANYYASAGEYIWPQVTPFVLTVVFVACYGGGVGPVASLMVSELLPGPVRGLGAGLANALLCGAQFGLTYIAPSTDQEFTVSCWGYGGGCLLLAGFSILLPETRRRPLEELEEFWREAAEKGACGGCLTQRKLPNSPIPHPATPGSCLYTYDHLPGVLPSLSNPHISLPHPTIFILPHSNQTSHLTTSASLPNTFAPIHGFPALCPSSPCPIVPSLPSSPAANPSISTPLLNIPVPRPTTTTTTTITHAVAGGETSNHEDVDRAPQTAVMQPWRGSTKCHFFLHGAVG